MGDPSRPSYIALFDILGFTDIVRREQLPGVVETLKQLNLDAELYAEPVNIRVLQFSDTILLYSDGDDEKSLAEIVRLSALLVGRLLERRVRMRGAITWGEFYAHKQIFAGKAMIRAYQLEKSQDWAGGIIDPALIAKLEREDTHLIRALQESLPTVTHPAPIKGGTAGEFHCLAWPRFFSRSNSLDAAWPIDGTEGWDVLRKRHNTAEFLNSFEEDDRPP